MMCLNHTNISHVAAPLISSDETRGHAGFAESLVLLWSLNPTRACCMECWSPEIRILRSFVGFYVRLSLLEAFMIEINC